MISPGHIAVAMAESSEFHVGLKGLKLPRESLKRIEALVREAVLAEVARLDFHGDLSIAARSRLNPEWLGIWIDAKLGKRVRTTKGY